MSAVSSIGSSAQSLLTQQAQQRLLGGNIRPPGDPGDNQAAFQSAALAAGVDPSKVASLLGQIEQAVQGAIKSAGTTGDRHAAVQSAVDTVLKNNGIDPDKFKSQLQAAHHEHGAHRHHGRHGASGASTANSVAAPLADATEPQPLGGDTGLFIDTAA